MNRSILAVALTTALLVSGCGPLKYTLQSTDKAPGADATLFADIHADQGNTRVDFTATNLAPPDRIETGDTAFVAWWRKDDKALWQRIGALQYSPEKRYGSLEAGSVPETAFDFQVSGEKAVDAASPSPSIIFAQHVAPKK